MLGQLMACSATKIHFYLHNTFTSKTVGKVTVIKVLNNLKLPKYSKISTNRTQEQERGATINLILSIGYLYVSYKCRVPT